MRLPRLLLVLAVLAAVLPLAGPTIASGCACDSRHFRHYGSVIRVYPTHHYDTANPRCDKTNLSNPGPLHVGTGNVLMSPPSRTNLWPALVTLSTASSPSPP